MSRIGRAPVAIPAGVEVNVADNNVVTVKGPKGTLTQQFNANLTITVEGNVATVARRARNADFVEKRIKFCCYHMKITMYF